MVKVNCDVIIGLFREPASSLSLTLAQWQKIILVLRHHQLLARYAQHFIDNDVFVGLPPYCQHHFRNALVIAENQYLQVRFEASEIVKVLKSTTEFTVFLKGAGYVLSALPVGKNRISSDIDVLINLSALKEAEKLLFLAGWVSDPISDYDDRYYRQWAHEIPPLRHSKRGTVIDLHHNIVPLVSGRAPDVRVLTEHIVTTAEGLMVLSPAAMTLHSAIHLFFNEEMHKGYRDLLDLHMLMSSAMDQDYWATLVKLARDTGFGLELTLACRYTQMILGTTIPATAVAQLPKIGKFKQRLYDFMFLRLLSPAHPYSLPDFYSLAELMVLVRGHFLKMPLYILGYHLLAKSFISVCQRLLGKHVFEKDLEKP